MTSSTPPEEDHHHDGAAEEEERTRALETIAALASILGQPTEWIPQKTQAEKAEPLPGTSTKNASTEVVVEAVLPATTEVEEVEAAPTTTTSPSSVVEADSVSAWAVGIKQRKKHRELSDDSMPGDCPVLLPPPPPPPHRRDPSSVQILDQDSLERNSGMSSQVPAPMFKDGRVIFREKVSMVEIPSYRDVDPEIAERVWTSPEEVHRNLERNAWEYNSVGRDWTKVLEEDQMIYDSATGQYIHPATWELMEIERQEEERQQELMRLAQQEAERRQRVALEQEEAERRQRVALEEAAAAKQAQKQKKQQQQQQQQQRNKPRRRQTGRPPATGQQQRPSSPKQPTSSQRRRRTSPNISPQTAGHGAGQKHQHQHQQRQSPSSKGSPPRATKSFSGRRSGRRTHPPTVSASGGSLTRFADT